MNFDFPTIMVIFLVVCGIIWLADALLWAPRRREAVAAATRAAGPKATKARLPVRSMGSIGSSVS